MGRLGSLYTPAAVVGLSYPLQIISAVKPTTRVDGSALVVGDRWWKNNDGTEWFWNGTYWVSASTYTFSTPTTTITSAGNSFISTGVPDNNWICDQAYIYYVQLGGGGTNQWSPTAYFGISLEIGKIDSTFFVSMANTNTTTARGGFTSSTPTVRLTTNSSTALRILCTAETNDPVNGSVFGTLILRKLYV